MLDRFILTFVYQWVLMKFSKHYWRALIYTKEIFLGIVCRFQCHTMVLKLFQKGLSILFTQEGLKIMIWTINDIKTFKYLIDLGVDGIITDKPKLLFQTIEELT